MAIRYDVMSKRVYTDRDGNEKTAWTKHGHVGDTKSGGLYLKLESIPVNGDGFFSLFEPKQDDRKGDNRRSVQVQAPELNDDIPF